MKVDVSFSRKYKNLPCHRKEYDQPKNCGVYKIMQAILLWKVIKIKKYHYFRGGRQSKESGRATLSQISLSVCLKLRINRQKQQNEWAHFTLDLDPVFVSFSSRNNARCLTPEIQQHLFFIFYFIKISVMDLSTNFSMGITTWT